MLNGRHVLVTLSSLALASCLQFPGLGVEPECERDSDCDDDEECDDDECVEIEGDEGEGEGEGDSDSELSVTRLRYDTQVGAHQAGTNQRFVLVTGRLHNSTSDELPLGASFFSVTTASSLVFFASTSASGEVDDPCPDADGLAPDGTTSSCTIAYEIPATDDAVRAVYDDNNGHRFESSLPEPEVVTCPRTAPSTADDQCFSDCVGTSGGGPAANAYGACRSQSECTGENSQASGPCAADGIDFCVCLAEQGCTDCVEELSTYMVFVNACNAECG